MRDLSRQGGRYRYRCLLQLVVSGLLLAVGNMSLAQTHRDRIAILELGNKTDLSAAEVGYLTDLIRDSARQQLSVNRYVIMTRENIIDLLGDRAMADCIGECAVQTGRNLGAKYVVAGEVIYFGKSIRISVTLHETEFGNLLESEQAGAPGVEGLEESVRRMGEVLMHAILPQKEVQDSYEASFKKKNSVGMEMVQIPAGSFMMGSPRYEEERSNEEVQHRIEITHEFLMSSTEVTQAQYSLVVHSNPSFFKDPWNPVDQVSWFESIQFCNLLSTQEGLTPAYEINGEAVLWNADANGYRLPTEAEWEYACRAGNPARFHRGDHETDLSHVGWYLSNSGGGSRRLSSSRKARHSVGEKEPNTWGLSDMHGNVWEWCYDWFSSTYYTHSPSTDPVGPSDGIKRVTRGGAMRDTAKRCRSASRGKEKPGNRSLHGGFRVVRTLD